MSINFNINNVIVILQDMVLIMKHNWDISVSSKTSEDQKYILYHHAGFALIITKGFIVSVYFFIILMFFLPFIYGIGSDPARNKRYPFSSWYYWDQNSDVIYAIAYLIQVLSDSKVMEPIVDQRIFKFV